VNIARNYDLIYYVVEACDYVCKKWVHKEKER